jgi:hypothetical protein
MYSMQLLYLCRIKCTVHKQDVLIPALPSLLHQPVRPGADSATVLVKGNQTEKARMKTKAKHRKTKSARNRKIYLRLKQSFNRLTIYFEKGTFLKKININFICV